MPEPSLLTLFEDFSGSDDLFLVHDDGYRVRQVTYRELARRARTCAARLRRAGVGGGDRVVIWAENSVEWVTALWGCVLLQAVVVPVDERTSGALLARITAVVRATLVLVGGEVTVPDGLGAPVRTLAEIAGPGSAGEASAADPEAATVPASTLAEILFTSGATADPKGVRITHGNILANVVPIQRGLRPYLRYERPFHPIRFLNLLPLSHMFGQSMATFVPPLLRGTVVFSHGYNPVEILHEIRSRRVSVLVCVPKVLDMLRAHIESVAPFAREPDALGGRHFLWRWWRYRAVHRLFGWKFWCIVCGGAPLPPEVEAFFRKLGLLVVQGYGLTETAPVVTLNHPLRAAQGTVGTPLEGVEVRIAPDGEILVRGPNVTSGYYRPEGADGKDTSDAPDRSAFEDGWFHTGDIGDFDATGRLRIKGRKKEMIVTAQGLNVFPEDVESILVQQPGVREAAVVGMPRGGRERVHAVLVVEPGADVAAAVRRANTRLEDHQRVAGTSIWPGQALPRTDGTQKLRRREILRWALGDAPGMPDASAHAAASVRGLIEAFAPGQAVGGTTTLEELGLSSLDRVELLMAMERAFQISLDEQAVDQSCSVDRLETIVTALRAPAPEASVATPVTRPATHRARVGHRPKTDAGPIAFPSWNRSLPARALRAVSLDTWILPIGRRFMNLEVRGLPHLDEVGGPVVFAANHQSHLDTPAVLAALPARWRHRVAPAMAKEFFGAHFSPAHAPLAARLRSRVLYYLACEFFNAFPLPQREAGTRQTLRYMGTLLADGYSVLIFPEGRRTSGGAIGPFRPGVGMIGSRLDVPVVPVRLEGLDTVLPTGARTPTRGRVRVTFGAALRLEGTDYAALADRVADAVRRL